MCSILLSLLSAESSLDEILDNIYIIYCFNILMIMSAIYNYNILCYVNFIFQFSETQYNSHDCLPFHNEICSASLEPGVV